MPCGEAVSVRFEILYVILTTVIAVGLGDITPMGAIARIWSALAEVAGFLLGAPV